MSSRLSCAQAQELAPELALGIISGDDRALLLTHIAGCPGCRRLVEKLSERADELLLLAPDDEPPAGFETRVLARLGGIDRRRRRTFFVAAAAALLFGVAGAGGVLWVTAEDREIAAHYKHALAEANGDYFGVKPLHSADGTKMGNVFSYGGDTDWVFVVFSDGMRPGVYDIDIKTSDRGTVGAGVITLGENDRTWGSDLRVDLKNVDALVFSERSGLVYEADFSH